MVDDPASEIPAILLLIVGFAIVAWSVPEIYALTGSVGEWERIGLLVFVPALILGLFDVGIGLLCYSGWFSIAGPTALLSGQTVLLVPLLLQWGGFGIQPPHPGFLLLAALGATGSVYLGFEIRRQFSAERG